MPALTNPRYRDFAFRLRSGQSQTDAYLGAGFKCSRAAARSNASRLMNRQDVADYLEELRRLPTSQFPLIQLAPRPPAALRR